MPAAYVLAAYRTPGTRAKKGKLKDVRPDDLAAAALQGLLRRTGVDPMTIDDVILGCAFPEAEQGMNMARIASLKAGLPVEVPGQTINRFCSSGLQAIATAAERIMAGRKVLFRGHPVAAVCATDPHIAEDAAALIEVDTTYTMALAAQASRVQRMVVGQGARVLLVGVVLGLAAAAASTRALRSLLFCVGALDPRTFAAVAGGMVLVGLLAAYLRARRASRVDPIESLRGE